MSWAFDAMDDARERAEQVNQLREENAQLRAQIAELLATKPGTWAWACERMLEGKVVERHDYLHGTARKRIGHLDHIETRLGTYHRTLQVAESKSDLTATDWRVVEDEKGGA